MIPLSDHTPTRRFPIITVLLIGACLWVYFVVQPSPISTPATTPERAQINELLFNVQYAAIPCEVMENRPITISEAQQTFVQGDDTACQDVPIGNPVASEKNIYLSVLYSMFLHGGLLHLGGNLLFLWIFGNNVEDRMGHIRYLMFYLASGLAATAGHIFAQPDSTVPIVGASGAIAGVMGAYLVLHPNSMVSALIGLFPVHLTAKWFLLFWFVSQFFINPNEGVAWVAHVAGFIFGVAGGIWVRIRYPERPEALMTVRQPPYQR